MSSRKPQGIKAALDPPTPLCKYPKVWGVSYRGEALRRALLDNEWPTIHEITAEAEYKGE